MSFTLNNIQYTLQKDWLKRKVIVNAVSNSPAQPKTIDEARKLADAYLKRGK